MTEIKMVKNWLARAHVVEAEHFQHCVMFRRRHYIWGAVLICSLSLASALTAIVERNEVPESIANILIFPRILLALFVPVAAALVTFLAYQARSERHHYAAARFSALKRRLFLVLSDAEAGAHKDTRKVLSEVCRDWDDLTLNTPALYRKNTEKEWKADIASLEAEFDRQLSPDVNISGNREHKIPVLPPMPPASARLSLPGEAECQPRAV
jgi:hypothetical protein